MVAEVSSSLGERLRHLREARGLTLRSLAERCGLSASLLSQLEREQTNPTVDTIRRLAQGLEVSIFELLSDAPQEGMVVVRPDRRRKVVIQDGQLSHELLSPDTKGQLEVWMGRLAPDAEMGPEESSHPSEEFILVLEGVMEIRIAGESYLLEPGCSIQYDGNLPHKIFSRGEGELRFISALTPPTL